MDESYEELFKDLEKYIEENWIREGVEPSSPGYDKEQIPDPTGVPSIIPD